MHSFKNQHGFKLKQRQMPNKVRREIKECSPRELIVKSYNNLMKELQSKYTGLYEMKHDIGMKNHFHLLKSIGRVINERLVDLVMFDLNVKTAFQLTQVYRKKYPHSQDYELIMSSLHKLQDSLGETRTQLTEEDLLPSAQLLPYMIDNMPFEIIKTMSSKFLNQITDKITDYVNNMPTIVSPDDTSEEEAARVRVREVIKKLAPYLPEIITDIAKFEPAPAQGASSQRVKVYGEPYLPYKRIVAPYLERFGVLAPARDEQMFNLLHVQVPRDRALDLLAADGEPIVDAKLVIRPFELFYRRVPLSMLDKNT